MGTGCWTDADEHHGQQLCHTKRPCRVIAWEPVPRFRDFLEYGVALNNLSALVTVR